MQLRVLYLFIQLTYYNDLTMFGLLTILVRVLLMQLEIARGRYYYTLLSPWSSQL